MPHPNIRSLNYNVDKLREFLASLDGNVRRNSKLKFSIKHGILLFIASDKKAAEFVFKFAKT